MQKPFKKALFLFRRGLRLDDNTGLIAACEQADQVIPAFVFDPRQVDKNAYRSDNCVQFMVESLKDLQGQLKAKGGKLYLFYGQQDKVVGQLIKKEKLDAVFMNRDYTPFAKRRDAQIRKVCKDKAEVHVYGDYLLNEPEEVHKSDGKHYTVFTPFYNSAKQHKVRKPKKNNHKNYFNKPITQESKDPFKKVLKEENKELHVRGGRTQGLKLLKRATKLSKYNKERDLLAEDGTTNLSAHNKFGTVSIREVYEQVKASRNEPLVRQLYWRDFFTHIAFHFPKVFGSAFHDKYDKVKWDNSKAHFKRWCGGATGFPVVDAGMRQLNQTGYMHNRARMIVASFLVKDLLIDWRWGEKYFAQQLVDYDPSVNNGSWQWAASTGCDAAPYFRIFNPWLQQKKYDPHSEYIKRWVPELKDLSTKEINSLDKKRPENLGYPEPIVDHKERSAKAKAAFKKVV